MIKIVEIELTYHNRVNKVELKVIYYNQATINIITLE